MKINWFSPLPPARSETARQTAAILPLLSQRAEVTVWSNETWSPLSGLDRVTIKRFDAARPPWREISAAEITFYQFGGDPRDDEAIWRISRQHPGVVILHEVNLQYFFHALMQNGGLTRREYLNLIEVHHGLIGRMLAEFHLHGRTTLETLAEHCPLTDAVVENALAVVVHSEGALRPGTTAVPMIQLSLARGEPPGARSHAAAGPRSSNDSFRITKSYVDGLMEIAERISAFQTHWIAHRLAQRAGALISGQSCASANDYFWRRIAQEIQTLAAPDR